MSIPVAAVAAAVASLATACGGGSSSSGQQAGPPEHPAKLIADVGHGGGFSISLTDPAGKAIGKLAAGTYTLDVNDEASNHNFHVFGKGVEASTNVPAVEKKTFTVTFTPGTYTFQCDVHVSQMHGTFTVS